MRRRSTRWLEEGLRRSSWSRQRRLTRGHGRPSDFGLARVVQNVAPCRRRGGLARSDDRRLRLRSRPDRDGRAWLLQDGQRVLRLALWLARVVRAAQLPEGVRGGELAGGAPQQHRLDGAGRGDQHRAGLVWRPTGLARFRFAGRLATRLLFIGGLVVPVQLIILPLFIMFRQIGILGDLRSLIAVYAIFGIPLGVLVLTGFFAALPRDLEEAARIDGASHFEVFWRIMLPLTRPAIAAVVILNGVWMWNDFFLGFILLTKPDAMTLPVAIMAFRGTFSTEWGLIFASVTVSALPVVIAYLLLSRQFIAGLTAGSVKG